MSGFLFSGKSKSQKIEEAKVLLEENGYLVRGPLLHKNDVKGPSDLVKFFYDKMAQHNPDLLMYYSSTQGRDLGIAKKLIEAREELGMSSERALIECCALIDALFRYEDYIGLSFKITSMSILTQDSMSWVIHKLTDIINGFNRDLFTTQEEAWFRHFYKEQDDIVPDDLVARAYKRLELEDDDGKKED